jgi:glutamate synthase domain-containing protein 2
MKEEKFILQETHAKAYFANKDNIEKTKDEKLKVYSENKEFILIYCEDDPQKILNLHRFMEYQDYQQKCSVEDQIYDDFLKEFGIWNTEFDKWLTICQEVDKATEISVPFVIGEMKFDVLLNKMESLQDGSDVIFGLSSDNNRGFFLTVAKGKRTIKEEIENE